MDFTNCVKTFICVVDCNSFTQAARKMHTTPPVISKRIHWLEEELNTTLMYRTTRSRSLTESGKLLYTRSRELLSEWDIVRDDLQRLHDDPSGIIHLGIPENFGEATLSSLILDFLALHPKIQIHQVCVSQPSNILDDQLDIYLTHEQTQTENIAIKEEKLYCAVKQLYASPHYLERAGTPQSLTDLKNHNCLICSKHDHNTQWEFIDNKISVSGNYSSPNFEALTAAACKGLGIIYSTEKPLLSAIQSGQLIPVLPQHHSPHLEIKMIYPATTSLAAKIKQLIVFLQTHLKVATAYPSNEMLHEALAS